MLLFSFGSRSRSPLRTLLAHHAGNPSTHPKEPRSVASFRHVCDAGPSLALHDREKQRHRSLEKQLPSQPPPLTSAAKRLRLSTERRGAQPAASETGRSAQASAQPCAQHCSLLLPLPRPASLPLEPQRPRLRS